MSEIGSQHKGSSAQLPLQRASGTINFVSQPRVAASDVLASFNPDKWINPSILGCGCGCRWAVGRDKSKLWGPLVYNIVEALSLHETS